MRICHISDTHVAAGSGFNREVFLSTMEDIENEEFDLLIHTGDITNSGALEEYVIAKELFGKISIPHVIIPGNHDARNGGLDLFEEYIAPSSDVREFDDTVVVYVNSSISDSNEGRVGMVKFRMMKEAFDIHQDRRYTILAIHHHLLPIPRSGRERNVLSNAGDILDLLLRYDIDLVVSGHRHYPNIHRVEDTLFVNAGTLSSTKTRYGDVNSYDVIELDEERSSVTVRRADGRRQSSSFNRVRTNIFNELGDKEHRLVQISNTFISRDKEFLPKHFRNASRNINLLKPDIVVHCGGVVNEGTVQDYKMAREQMDLMDSPVIYTPAGRDINYMGYRLFRSFFGPYDQEWSDGEILIRGYSTAQYDSPLGIMGETQRKLIIKELPRRKEGFRALFQHHNLIPIPHSREKGLLEDAGDLLRNIVDLGVELVLTGTSSHPFAAKVGGTLIVNANSMSSRYQRSDFGNSFNVIDIYERAIAVSEINSLWGTKRLLGLWPRNNGMQN